MKKFREFLIESFSVRETEFGTDYKNKMFSEKTSSISTFFEHEGVKVKIVYFKNKTLSFGVYSEKEDQWILNPDKSNSKFRNIFDFYGKLIYIVLKMIETLSVNELKFTGANKTLDRVYFSMFKNKSFIKILTSKGFELEVTEENDDIEFTMRKK